MRSNGANGVGRFSVDIELANNDDLALVRRGLLKPRVVRRLTIPALVDSGATKLVLPESVAKKLGLSLNRKITVQYAGGRRSKRNEAEGVHLSLLDRDGVFAAIVEPRRETALVGAIVLEDLDLLVDCQCQRVIPRDPRGPIFEVE
jgi:hypothetical protein